MVDLHNEEGMGGKYFPDYLGADFPVSGINKLGSGKATQSNIASFKNVGRMCHLLGAIGKQKIGRIASSARDRMLRINQK
jgi:hypothetical protein